MLRMLMAGLAALVVTGCGYGSDVDLAPMAERAATPVIAPGDYCEATASSPPYMVRSGKDCVQIVWDQAARTHSLDEGEEDENPTVVAPVDLGDGLYLLQAATSGRDGAAHHEITLAIASGNAFYVLPKLTRETYVKFAAKHPEVTWRSFREDPVIAAGDPAAIKAMLKDLAHEALSTASLEDKELSVAIRDRQGAPDHEANGMQTMNIIELVTAVFALQSEE